VEGAPVVARDREEAKGSPYLKEADPGEKSGNLTPENKGGGKTITYRKTLLISGGMCPERRKKAASEKG